ncbi:serine/threonine-protein kinase, partial [Nocardiopsis sp. MG754419]|uniref:serine/threonine-protein kinase n=1 Tax=Nocardiopsis sp. MG754419 TaxID=2259865 RepID=UPI001BA832AB
MTPPLHALQPHDPAHLGGRRVLGRIGTGERSTVYLAEEPDGTRVAIRVLDPEGAVDPEARRRCAREAEAARRVVCPRTAAVLDADFSSVPAHVVSEYVEGTGLDRAVADEGPLSGDALMRLAVAVADALVSVHEAGLLHRDLEPGNVVMASGGPRVIGFGVSRIIKGVGAPSDPAVGAPGYMSPEHLADGRVTAATDVFSWGAVVVFAATGRAPFDAATVPGVLHKVLKVDPELGGLAEPLRSVVAAALDKDPDARPTSRQVLHRLRDHVCEASRALEAPPATDPPSDAAPADGAGVDTAPP